MATQAPTRSPAALAQPQYEITAADKARVKQIADAWLAYGGKLDKPLEKMPDQPDLNVLSNRCQAIVDRGVDFLFGDELEINVGETDPKEAQDFLNDTWGRKEQRLPLLQKLGLSGANAGQAFMRIVPDKAGSAFRLVIVDPATVYVRTAPQDCETVLLYCIQYSAPSDDSTPTQPRTTYYREEMQRIDPDGNSLRDQPDDDDTWQIQHWSQVVSGNSMEPKKGNWTPAGAPIPWAYPFPPLFSNQNLPNPHDFWGFSDLPPDLVGINVALNLTQSLISQTEWIYGNPVIYATGTGQQVIEIQPGRIIGLPTTESKIVAVPVTTDVPNALKFANSLRGDIDEQSSVPGVATGRLEALPRGAIAGIAIQLLFMPLLKKTDKKRCLYGKLIIDVSKALLVLNRMSGDIEITLPWQNPLPTDDLATAQAAVAKKGLGISDATLQREMGYDPEEEMELSQTEDAAKVAAYLQGQATAMPGQVAPGQPGLAAPASGGMQS
jgi:hypothetical protein